MTAPHIGPAPTQKLDVMSELAIYFRDELKEDPVHFNHVVYQLQGGGSFMVLTVIETRGDQRTHIFHWEDILKIVATPSVIAT